MTWNSKFDEIEQFLKELDKKNRNLVVIIDPHIKRDRDYTIYREALKHGKSNILLLFLEYFISDIPRLNISDNFAFEGLCWCEEAIYLNFYDESVRNFWKNQILNSEFFFKANNIHIWNDMNEPSVFNQADMTFPKRVLFKYNETFYEHRDAHNAYGYLMHRSSYEALKTKYKNRPFVLTRSFYLGSHKYGAVWTGDTRSTFSDMAQSVPMILSMSISGFSFVGADVGGFHGEVDYHLLIRWYQLGVFYPFYRAHSHNECNRREPWLYDQETLFNIKQSIITRYMLLPYLYLTFFQYYKTGMPVVRPLWFYYKDKFSLIDHSDSQFFLGDCLMIRPILKEKELYTYINLYLPQEDRWYDFYDNKEYLNKGEIKIGMSEKKIGAFIKGGSIFPMKWRMRRSSKLMKSDPFTLVIALNNEESASGMLYIDDEVSYDYKDSDTYCLKRIIFLKNEIFNENINDKYKTTNTIERIIILGIYKKVEHISFSLLSETKNKQSDLEYESMDEGILEIKRLKIPVNQLWKIKLNYKNI
jgi:alpha 1,3-glucosidase